MTDRNRLCGIFCKESSFLSSLEANAFSLETNYISGSYDFAKPLNTFVFPIQPRCAFKHLSNIYDATFHKYSKRRKAYENPCPSPNITRKIKLPIVLTPFCTMRLLHANTCSKSTIRWEICSKLTTKTPVLCHWRRSALSLLLTLNRLLTFFNGLYY